ncbi:phosphoribosylanthranilate isomerase [Acetobacter sp.]|jgi:phosphoribosylanthranilate isomerase|uniref:phosphoribosylanthranilate isomerase n=1 Tax=Acetobacter sp. TaxID=440 RepID=UPI0025BCBC87|nr:phosphoribosylanthranilate isomerase [Acetobacter sp.]MCH4092610.1 phosphoribosylanthranilate isomerase [Acetobacter sp.]MCI1299744.1 phosphoribosylanthranilate isomerase [Acetobacter sp.]MCI1315376.1 phosphoribosylanthranilate isomerase [Acetobacter sp.]
MAVGVKICGLTEERGLDACLEYGADWIGLNFFAKSPRHVTPMRAAELARRVDGSRSVCVGLFVEPTDEEVTAVLDAVPLDVLQLYTTAERALSLARRSGKEVWLSCPVSNRADLPVQCDVQRLVIESRAPKDAGRPGGNGLTLPWDVTAGWTAPVPWILAGGLTPENVGQAVRVSGAPAVDVASGVESEPGIKDPTAIKQFIERARSARMA